MSVLKTLVEFTALAGAWLLLPLLLAALAGLIALGRGHRFFLPPTWLARAAMALLIVFALTTSLLLYALDGPLGRLADGLRALRGSIGQEAPDIAFRQVSDDAPMTLYSVRGQVTLVNLWATWCPPCVQELPELDRLQKSYRERGLVVVTLSQEERQLLLEFAAENDYSMTNVYSEELDWLNAGRSRPISVILDRNGRVRDFTIGMQDYEAFEAMVEPYLAEPSRL
ncbi:MAG: TlpA disulfide reductase family protein [Acidobacteriota bacterium]